MKLYQIIAIAILVSSVTAGAFAQNADGQTFSKGKEYSIHSKILDEDRTYWVSLPTSYDDSNFGPEKYPVIYAVDGKSVFYPLAGLVNFMGGRESVNFQIPEAIVVGVDTPNRERDLTPHGGEPQKALESFQNALRLNPDNKALEEKIQQLKKYIKLAGPELMILQNLHPPHLLIKERMNCPVQHGHHPCYYQWEIEY